jgi:hypothetical protein
MVRTIPKGRRIPSFRHIVAGVAGAVILAPSGTAAADGLPRTAHEWGAFTFDAMLATGVLVAVVLVARSSWRKRLKQAEETARANGVPVDPSWRYRVAARWSWGVSVAGLGFGVLASSAEYKLPASLLGSMVMLAGPFLALYAVLGASGPARKKVLVPAAIGAFIPLFFLCAAVAQVFVLPERPRPPVVGTAPVRD